MIILGIDPGLATTGFGLISGERNQDKKFLACGHIKTLKSTPLAERLFQIENDFIEIVKRYKPDVIAIEQLFFFKNVTTAINVAHARGVIMSQSFKHKLKIYEYTPLQVKQGLTGYGKSTKKEIQDMVKLELKLKQIPKPDDAADALALSIICFNQALKEEKIDKN